MANKLRMSVSVTTPVRRPERWEPGRADAGTDGEGICGPAAAGCDDEGAELGTNTVGAIEGVVGAEWDGEADSTTHMRCEFVATSFATVCASVEYGFT